MRVTDDGIYTMDDLIEDMIQDRAEASKRGPMTGVPPTWEWLVEQEPELGRLLDECQRLRNPAKSYDRWYGKGGLSGIKHRMCQLVGRSRLDPRGHPDLYDTYAYDLAYETLLGALGGRS